MPHSWTALLIILAVIGACVTGSPSATALQDTSNDKVLRIHWWSDPPTTVDPQRVVYINDVPVAGLNWEGLTRIDAEMNTVPAAAESWAFSPDGLTLTFHLRDNLVYSDGSPLTAERFRYAIERACNPRTASPYAHVLFAIEGCEAFFTSMETITGDDSVTPGTKLDLPAFIAARASLGVRAIDEQTLELRLRTPAAYLPTVASLSIFFPVKQELIAAGGDAWWQDPANLIGNGPFQLVSLRNATDASSQTAFTANARYWAGRPKLDRIEYRTRDAWNTRAGLVAAYERGELDMAFLLEPPDSSLAPDQIYTPRTGTEYLGFNLTREPFTDPKVRQAFAYGFDRESFCREVIFNRCTPTLSWIPPGVPGHTESSAYAFDPKRAREALAESSYGGPAGLPKITWYFNPSLGEVNLYSKRVADWIAAQYRDVLGVELVLHPLSEEEWGPIFDVPLEDKPQLMFEIWLQDYPDPQNWLSVYWTCASPWSTSRAGYCNPAFDALIERADAELDPTTRLALYQEAELLLLADAPAIFLYNPKFAVLVKPYVTGYAVTGMDYWPGWTTPLTIDVESGCSSSNPRRHASAANAKLAKGHLRSCN